MDVQEGGGELVEDECWGVEIDEGTLNRSRRRKCVSGFNGSCGQWPGGNVVVIECFRSG